MELRYKTRYTPTYYCTSHIVQHHVNEQQPYMYTITKMQLHEPFA